MHQGYRLKERQAEAPLQSLVRGEGTVGEDLGPVLRGKGQQERREKGARHPPV